MQALGDIEALHLRGLIELHWSDDDGSHHEQGDLEVWVQGHSHASARVTKFGDVYMWTGSTPDGDFTFDLTGEPTTLTTSHPNAGAGSILHPSALRRLLGMVGLPADAVATSMDNAVQVAFDRADGSHEVIELDASGSNVTLVTITMPNGRTVMAEHRTHNDGLTIGQRPFARYVDVRSGDDLARFFLASIETPDEVPGAVFNVDRLTRALRPDQIRHEAAP
jgi:hypothetical protein